MSDGKGSFEVGQAGKAVDIRGLSHVVIVPAGLLIALTAYPIYAIVDGWVKVLIVHSCSIFWLHDIASKLLLPMFSLIAISRFYANVPCDVFRINRKSIFNEPYCYYTFVAICVGAFGLLVQHILSYRWPPTPVIPEGAIQALNPFGKAVVWAYLAVTAALFEEIFFRGAIYRIVYLLANKNLSSRVIDILFIFLSSVFFCLAHWENGYANMSFALIVGVFYSSLYLKAKVIWPFVVAHLIVDMLTLVWR